jgi:hypothetical protein
MEIQGKLLSFASLYEVAGLLDPVNSYEKQNELAAYCRSAGKPFLVKMLYRHRFRCKACGIEMGEAALHFEAPSPSPEEATSPSGSQPSSGYSCGIQLSTLHGILAHGDAMPDKLQELFSRVRT